MLQYINTFCGIVSFSVNLVRCTCSGLSNLNSIACTSNTRFFTAKTRPNLHPLLHLLMILQQVGEKQSFVSITWVYNKCSHYVQGEQIVKNSHKMVVKLYFEKFWQPLEQTARQRMLSVQLCFPPVLNCRQNLSLYYLMSSCDTSVDGIGSLSTNSQLPSLFIPCLYNCCQLPLKSAYWVQPLQSH